MLPGKNTDMDTKIRIITNIRALACVAALALVTNCGVVTPSYKPRFGARFEQPYWAGQCTAVEE